MNEPMLDQLNFTSFDISNLSASTIQEIDSDEEEELSNRMQLTAIQNSIGSIDQVVPTDQKLSISDITISLLLAPRLSIHLHLN